MSIRVIVTMQLAAFISSCSTVSDWVGLGGEVTEIQAKETVKDEEPSVAATSPETSLGRARIWARLDELEDRLRVQSAKIKLLEKGLMLGIIPEELKHPADKVTSAQPEPKLMPEVSDDVPKPAEVVAAKDVEVEKPKEVDEKQYQTALAEAQDYFRTGRYGKAITRFEFIASEFPSKVKDGSHLYWIGLSWYNLREYETSKKVFAELVEQNSSSPWVARAKFNIARCNNSLGLKRQAIGGLKEIIKTHPYEDAAEMARMEIQRIEQAL